MVYVNVNMHGQITLPAGMRQELDIKPKTTLEITLENGRLELRKAKVVGEESLKKIAELIKQKKVTKAELIKACREIGEQTYAEEYGD